jgi:hypothetical protein
MSEFLAERKYGAIERFMCMYKITRKKNTANLEQEIIESTVNEASNYMIMEIISYYT